MTDEAWQEMINNDNKPPMPEWTNSFIREGKGEIPWPYYTNINSQFTIHNSK